MCIASCVLLTWMITFLDHGMYDLKTILAYMGPKLAVNVFCRCALFSSLITNILA